MTEIRNKSLQVFLDELASRAPAPGGGSAAALMGAQAAALVSMVCNLTIGKPKYAGVESEMRVLLEQAEALRESMTGMIKADVEAFEHLMAAYGLPKATDQQQLHRSEAIQAALKVATEVPLECAGLCIEAIKLSRVAAEIGNVNAVSDAGVAVMAAHAALKSAALNVYINTASIKDRGYAEARLTALSELINGSDAETEQIYQLVKGKL